MSLNTSRAGDPFADVRAGGFGERAFLGAFSTCSAFGCVDVFDSVPIISVPEGVAVDRGRLNQGETEGDQEECAIQGCI